MPGTLNFWRSEGLKHITPAGAQCPEGWDVWAFLGELIPGPLVEVGCGPGRLARAFRPGEYLGVDINPAAIELARELNPEHKFEEYRGQTAPTVLLYTVALHVPDADLDGFVAGLGADRVILAEILGRKWRREGNPPVFNREPDEYGAVFGGCGYRLSATTAKPYARYNGENIHFLDFRR